MHISVLEHCKKMNSRKFLNLIYLFIIFYLSLISKFFMLSRLSDFAVWYKSLFGVVGSISKV